MSSARSRSSRYSRHKIGSYRRIGRIGKWSMGLGLTGYTGFRIGSWMNQDDYWYTKRLVYGNREKLVDVPNEIRISENFSKNSKF